MQRKHKNNVRSSDPTPKSDAIDELRASLDLAERSCPGVSEILVRDIIKKLQPNISTSRLQDAVDKLSL